ncbi:MAG: hypothetical protein JST82_01045 [Bacteroidetes bacterium]|nr:hypothetical protein [Bacteroidota bacterium]
MKLHVLIFASLLIATTSFAQERKKSKDRLYAKKPLWIAMVDDTLTNYYEAEKAFSIYWQHHEKPETEHDIIGEHEERSKVPSRRRQRRLEEEEDKMRMEIRKYEKWHELILPYVKEDGRIMYPSERLQLWEKQQSK